MTGEAVRRACEKLTEALQGRTLSELKGQEFYGEYLAATDPLGADVPNPVSHVAYGYATQMCILDPKTGKIRQMVAAHDVGKAINPFSARATPSFAAPTTTYSPTAPSTKTLTRPTPPGSII